MRKPTCKSSRRKPDLRGLQARRALCLALLLALSGGARRVPGLQSRSTFAQPIGQHSLDDPDAANSDPAEEEKRLRALNADRQKSLVADANQCSSWPVNWMPRSAAQTPIRSPRPSFAKWPTSKNWRIA